MLSLIPRLRAGAGVEPLVHGRSRAGDLRRRRAARTRWARRHRPRASRARGWRLASATGARAWSSPPRSRSISPARSRPLGLRFAPAPGSALFLTGGFKTRHAELTLDDLLGAARGPARRSRATRGGPGVRNDRAHQPGLHALAPRRGERPLRRVRPGCASAFSIRCSLEEAATGATGLLAVFDLGNVGRSSTSSPRISRASRTVASGCSAAPRAPSCAAARSPPRSSSWARPAGDDRHRPARPHREWASGGDPARRRDSAPQRRRGARDVDDGDSRPRSSTPSPRSAIRRRRSAAPSIPRCARARRCRRAASTPASPRCSTASAGRGACGARRRARGRQGVVDTTPPAPMSMAPRTARRARAISIVLT